VPREMTRENEERFSLGGAARKPFPANSGAGVLVPDAGSRQMTDWLRSLLQRKPRIARMAWAMMTSGEAYRRPSVAARAVPDDRGFVT